RRRKGNVAKARRNEDVGAGTALEQPTTDLRPFGERVLRSRGLVVDAACIHVSAVTQQRVGNGKRGRLVERLLPIASARVHERGIRGKQLPELVDPAQP